MSPLCRSCRFTFPSWLRVAEHGGRGPCCAGRAGSLLCSDAEAYSHGLACLADHREFAVAVRAGRSSWFPGAVVMETAEISQLLLLRNRWLPVVLAALRGGVGLMGIFRALYTGTGLGVVSTGTRPP